MPYKNPEKRKAYDRERRRRERAAGGKTKKAVEEKAPASKKPVAEKASRAPAREKRSNPNLSLPSNPTAKDLLEVLRRQINAIQEANGEVIFRGRSIAYLVGVAVKVLEVGNVEERLAALENPGFAGTRA